MKPRKVWLSGASGFLGSHVARALFESDVDVVLTSKSGGQEAGRSILPVDALDSEAVAKSAAGCDSALICLGKVSRDASDAAELHQLHVEGTRSVLTGLRKAGVRRVVVASTSGTIAVGKDPKKIYDEAAESPLEHIAPWPYYRTKYYGEKLALGFASEDFHVVVVCPSLLLGPLDLRESSTGDVRRFLEKAIVAIPAGGIAFVDVRDAAQGMLLALERGENGQRYLLNGANMTLATFFARLSRISGVSAPLLKLPRNNELARGMFSIYEKGLRAIGGTPPVSETDVEMGQYFWYCSAKKAEQELGFTARDPGETLRDTIFDLIERQVVAPRELRRQINRSSDRTLLPG